MSLGEDQEELPISWAQLEQDLEFDEEITSAQTTWACMYLSYCAMGFMILCIYMLFQLIFAPIVL
jgi:hypothetical protein